jgi:hypothetical protein
MSELDRSLKRIFVSNKCVHSPEFDPLENVLVNFKNLASDSRG